MKVHVQSHRGFHVGAALPVLEPVLHVLGGLSMCPTCLKTWGFQSCGAVKCPHWALQGSRLKRDAAFRRKSAMLVEHGRQIGG